MSERVCDPGEELGFHPTEQTPELHFYLLQRRLYC